jgi:hypothetical protein
MRRALYASGSVHAAIILWVAIGGSLFRPSPDTEFEVTGVTLLSTQDFEALTQGTTPTPVVLETPVAPPPADIATAPQAPAPEAAAPVQTVPEETPAPQVEPQPGPVAPVPETDVTDQVAALQPPPVIDETLPTAPRPTPREAPRVAPTPAPAPEPDVDTAPEVLDRPTDDAVSDAPTPETPPTAPEEATTEIVTEAETPAASIAPLASVRPTARPERPQPTETAAAPEPVADPQPDPAPTPPQEPATDPLAAAIADAVADAVVSNVSDAAETTPDGNVPPISGGAREGFISAIRGCWNVGTTSSEALRTTVTVAFTMNQNGYPDAISFRLVSSEGGSDAAVRVAYDAARRAVLRCATQGRDGYDLPLESYPLWQEVEIRFNPEGMRLR